MYRYLPSISLPLLFLSASRPAIFFPSPSLLPLPRLSPASRCQAPSTTPLSSGVSLSRGSVPCLVLPPVPALCATPAPGSLGFPGYVSCSSPRVDPSCSHHRSPFALCWPLVLTFHSPRRFVSPSLPVASLEDGPCLPRRWSTWSGGRYFTSSAPLTSSGRSSDPQSLVNCRILQCLVDLRTPSPTTPPPPPPTPRRPLNRRAPKRAASPSRLRRPSPTV